MNQADSRPTSAEPDQGFVRVEGGNAQVSETGSVVTAYLAMWGVMMFFTWLGWRKLSTLGTRSDQLARALEQNTRE